MAAYHFTAKIHSRAKGASAVRAAAYRAAERLHDERLGVTEDYTRKADVVEAAILLPDGAPVWMGDRATLWNRVEARERRKDAQLAQELEINLPRELTDEENWRLITDFARQHLVAEGRVCDLAMHVHEASDGSLHPHAHILMPLRQVTPDGLGEKHPDCDWRRFLDRRDRLGELRALWGDFARDRAATLGVDLGPDWDHRSFADRGIDLEAQPKLGATAQRLEGQGTPADRTAEQEKIRRSNGERLLERPEIVLEALTGRQSTFTDADLARWIHRHATDEQFRPILDKAREAAASVGRDDKDVERFSTPEMIDLEARMVREAGALAGQSRHVVRGAGPRLANTMLSDEQRDAAQTLLEGGNLACLIGHAGAGKSTMLAEVRRELEAKGYTVRGAALSGIAAQNLSEGSGIEARTLASLTFAWDDERDRLTSNDVLVIDEAGMVGSRQLARFISEAGEVGAKLILVGDPEQIQAIEAGAAYRAVAERCPTVELTEIRRQQAEWQRTATRELATGRTADALSRYRDAGSVLTTDTDAEARALLVKHWWRDRQAAPDQSRIILAHTRADVRALNEEARARLRDAGRLGPDVEVDTINGTRAFATGDRLLFLRNERQLGVRNGTLGTIEELAPGRLIVRADDGRRIEVDPAAYRDLDHGYAVTIHKSQGVTVDATYLLASRGMDRHLAYVGCSRHRDKLTLVHSRESFADERALHRTLGRERAKDTTLDYREELEVDAPLDLPAHGSSPAIDVTAPLAPAPRPGALAVPAPKPTPEFFNAVGRPANVAQNPEKVSPAENGKIEDTAKPVEGDRPLTDVERAFIQQKNAAPSLEQAFRLKRDRGPRLGR